MIPRRRKLIIDILHKLPKLSIALKIYNDAKRLRKMGYGYKRIHRILRQKYGKRTPTITTVRRWVLGLCKPLGYYNLTLHEKADLAYIIGAFLGDGTLTRRKKGRTCHYVVLTTKDYDFAIAFSIRMARAISRKIVTPVWSKKRRYYVVRYSHIILYYMLKRIREDPFQIYDSIKKHPFDFLRGLYDAEGSVSSEKNHRIECGMTNQKCIRLVMELLEIKGYQPRFYKTKNKGKNKYIYKIVFSSLDDLIKFANEVGFSIRRKQRRLLHLIEVLKRREKR